MIISEEKYHRVEFDGIDYIRWSANNWGRVYGDSIYTEYSDEAKLEKAFIDASTMKYIITPEMIQELSNDTRYPLEKCKEILEFYRGDMFKSWKKIQSTGSQL